MKTGGTEANDIGIARTAHRTEQMEVIDGLEKIGLPVTVLAEHHRAFGRKLGVDALDVAEVADRDVLEPDVRARPRHGDCIQGHSRKGGSG
jgi:hypothetical protein